MKKHEIAEQLKNLSLKFKKDSYPESEFIFNFLSCFNLPKSTITRLKKGDYNLSKNPGEVFHRQKVFFKEAKTGALLETVDQLKKIEVKRNLQPRFVMATDYKTFVATDLQTNINTHFTIDELEDQVNFFLPLSGSEIYRVTNDNKADRDAAYHLSKLYDLLIEENPDWIEKGSHELNVFLARLLFCFFAEDTGIFEIEDVFTETLANNTSQDGNDVSQFLDQLFEKLNTENKQADFPKYLNPFPYVNGGLFKDTIHCPNFSRKSRQMLLDAGELDWSEINPDIFGSMIQAVADPSERNNLGMHYTSVENILKVIKPLFLDELYSEFEKNKDNPKALNNLLVRMGKIKFFDPACGSGNFLIITYKELRNLEIQIIKQLIDIQEQYKIYFTEISLNQFYGIEIKDFAREMAVLSLWLAEHQMNQIFETELLDYGKSKPLLPLKEAGKISLGNAARIDWETACPKEKDDEIYVIGNPPYLGARNQDDFQKTDMELVLKINSRILDYISIWFYKGAKYIENTNAELAFVSTNSITQGQQVSLLWPQILNENIEIGFAYHSFKWINNAKGNAGVTVIIVSLRNSSNKPKFIFMDGISKEAQNINGYLSDNANFYIKPLSKPISELNPMMKGNAAIDDGNFIFSIVETKEFKEKYPNQAYLLKEFIGAEELINKKKRYCLWLKDATKEDIEDNPEIRKRIENVQKFRSKSKKAQTRKFAEKPTLFMEDRQPDSDYLMIPVVSSEDRNYIPIGFLNKNIIANYSAFILPKATSTEFGVLHSRMHMVWVNAVGGKLETRYRYSAKLCYNTFPFPKITEKQKHIIEQYVFSVLDAREEYPEKTMAWLYNPESMPANLKQAHHELDEAIDRVYRLAPFRNDEERLEYLFKLYDEMLKEETLFAKQKKGRRKR